MPNIQFRNNEQAAKAVYQHILAAPSPVRHLTLRLRNPDDIKFTDWWLVPSRRWPPYEHSRLLFRQSHSTNMERRHLGGIPHTMFTGFHVTKGLGRQLPGIVKDDLMMTPQWYWYEFLNDVQGGVFDRPMQDIAQHTGLPVIVRLELYELNYVPDLTSKIQRPCNDSLEFIARPNDCSLELTDAANEHLAGLNGALNIRDLVWRTVALPKATWYWIDWLIGIRLGYGTEADGEWDAGDLWHNTLAPWLPRLR